MFFTVGATRPVWGPRRVAGAKAPHLRHSDLVMQGTGRMQKHRTAPAAESNQVEQQRPNLMTDYGTQESPSSRPPASGLVTYARLNNARQRVRVALDQLCQRIDEADTMRPPTQQAASVLTVMVGDLLVRHLNLEVSELNRIAFPVMREATERQNSIVGRFQDLEQALEAGRNMTSILGYAEELRRCAAEYFDWMDGFFCKQPR